MRNPLLHHVLAILCLAAVCFRAVASMGLVSCSAADGGVRLEWGCARDSAGQCGSDCDDLAAPDPSPGEDDQSPDPTEPAPCEDRPVATQASATLERSSKASLGVAHLFPVALLVATCHRAPWLSVERGCPTPRGGGLVESPPPGLGSLRTVILLV